MIILAEEVKDNASEKVDEAKEKASEVADAAKEKGQGNQYFCKQKYFLINVFYP